MFNEVSDHFPAVLVAEKLIIGCGVWIISRLFVASQLG